ncbi:MAG: endonuclease [Bacteriovoracaceae bacterium]|nr:endonuclease [Bacteriovoracaceae bacterium]
MKILLFVLFVSQAYAQSYYSEEFLNSKHALNEAELKSALYKIVSKNHKTTEYKEARKYLFGQLHLITNGKRLYKRLTKAEGSGKTFTIFDVYLGRELTDKDFKTGKGPTPFYINEDGTTPEQEKPDPEHTIINTEHTWPKSRFSTKHSHATQEGDLHHLFPTDARLNAIRSSHRFGMIQNPEENVGNAFLEGAEYQRDASVTDENGMAYKDHNNKYFEPSYEAHRGNIARALFYFSVRYELNIDPVEEIFLTLWNLEDPVDEDETLRNEAIYKIQNNRNPFIDYPELVLQY